MTAEHSKVEVIPTDHKLSPCPFCGTEAELNTASNDRAWMIISCPNIRCLVSPRIEGLYSELKETVGAWNQRVYVLETQT